MEKRPPKGGFAKPIDLIAPTVYLTRTGKSRLEEFRRGPGS